ncbi:hypothetical protein [Aquimarina algiphila]|uniref:Collagen-like protein n=1 Tax=Aquimarina algiphila TaxID=2047982 RepID=A0A554VRY3_9FLAO|nr:hypothetical protein [Aquimarina algiphila]TSE11448.1 hypothetical protein FOF46_00255 [Aquimarina algiphila]
MKKIFTLLCITTFMLTSCSNDDDTDFDTIGQSFEVDNVDFIGPEFAVNIPFPAGVEVFDADVVLVYRLEEVVNGNDVWEPLPTPLIILDSGGELTYRFNFTLNDVDILLDTPDIGLVGTNFTDNQVFRIVIVPSRFAQDSKIDFSDINAVQSALKLDF